ncbi:hypothetical protein V4B17_01070 [Bartonella sp. B23]
MSADVLTRAGTVEVQEGALILKVRDGFINDSTMRGDSVDIHVGSLINQGMLIAIHDLHLIISA